MIQVVQMIPQNKKKKKNQYLIGYGGGVLRGTSTNEEIIGHG